MLTSKVAAQETKSAIGSSNAAAAPAIGRMVGVGARATGALDPVTNLRSIGGISHLLTKCGGGACTTCTASA